MLDIDLLVQRIDDELGVPRATIAYLLHASNGQLSDWLSGRRPMPVGKIQELREILKALAEIADFCRPFAVDWRSASLVGGWLLFWESKSEEWKQEVKKLSEDQAVKQ